MHNVRLVAYLLSLLVIGSSAAQQPPLANVSFEQVLALPQREADFRISYGPSEFQFGELWLPVVAASDPVPLLVVIHGGCWLNSFDIAHSYGFNTALSELGYGVWALEYRRTGDAGGGWPGTFDDIRSGLEAITAFGRYSVDTERVAVLGHSAGGHLALLAGTEPQAGAAIDLVVGLAAIVDIEKYSRGTNSCHRATAQFMDGTVEQVAQRYEDANPVNRQMQTRAVLLQGDVDQIVPLEQAVLAGAETRIVAGAGHFDWIHPGTQAYAALIALLEEAF